MNSLLNQQESNYEIILVDDGSKDKSAEILDGYEEQNDFVQVIHKSNGGIGSTILPALERARGEYIVFVDSDDYVCKDMFSVLTETVRKYNSPDIIQFGLKMVDESNCIVREERHGEYQLTIRDEIISDHFENHPTPSLACRVFKKKLFNSAVYLMQNVGIDEILIVQLLLKASSLVSIDDVLYCVFLRKDSISRSACSKKKIEEYNNVYDFLFRISSDNVQLLSYIEIKYLKLIINIFLGLESHDSDLLRKYKELYCKVKSTQEYKKEYLSFKVGTKLFYYFPNIYKKIKLLKG